jgi:fucose 4-O-acetylase-like acetyltransferase
MDSSRRSLTVDVAKGLGILLVVLGHNVVFREGMHTAYEAIYLFHVPLFFFLSGVTFRYATPVVAFQKRFRSLLVPYFAMGAVAMAFCAVTAQPSMAVDELTGVLYGTGYTLRFTPLWFLTCLFVVSMSATGLLTVHARFAKRDVAAHANTRYLIAVATVSLVMGAWIIGSGRFGLPPFQDERGRPIGLPWSLDLVPFVLGIFVLGIALANARFLRECPRAWLVFIVGIATVGLLAANDVSLDLNYRRMTRLPATGVGIVAGMAAVIGLSSLIARSQRLARPFAYLGSASLVVLMFHSPIQRRLLDQLAPWIPSEPMLVAVTTALTVAIVCAFDLGVLRRIPALGWLCYPRRTATSAA